MDKAILEKLQKVQELINRGSSDGEKDAAKKAFERLVKRYELTEGDIKSIEVCDREFMFSNDFEKKLIFHIIDFLIPDNKIQTYKKAFKKKRVYIELKYVDWIIVESAYEYFRKHSKSQYQIHVVNVRKQRELEIINDMMSRSGFFITEDDIREMKQFKKYIAKFLKDLQTLFYSKYLIKSGFYNESQLNTEPDTREYNSDALKSMAKANVEGGKYNTQVTTGLYLEN